MEFKRVDFDIIMNDYTEMVNKALIDFLPKEDCLQKNVIEAMRYSISAGGKRIRPVLLLEFCRVCGGDVVSALPFACSVEMIHTYSLIHDDLPCMDDDDLRRGKPSCHVKFGEATALLAGDALLSLAFETALCNNCNSKIKSENIISAVCELAQASGANGMVGGQIIDLEYENKKTNLTVIETMHSKKTGAMIAAAAKMGCIIADAGEEKITAASEFAKKIGLAFQIVDDILDATSSDEKLGKPVGSDSENDKSTYVTHLGIEKSQILANQLTTDALCHLEIFGNENVFLKELAQRLANREN
jgi:geranylgeranyl diphosphate synthase type II